MDTSTATDTATESVEADEAIVTEDSPLAAEQEIFFSVPEMITTLKGDSIAVEFPISWRKQEQIVKIFSKAVAANPFPANMKNMPQIVNYAVKTLGSVGGDLTKIVSIILDENEEWVRDKLDFDTILGVVVPFVGNIFSSLNQTVLSGKRASGASKLVKAVAH